MGTYNRGILGPFSGTVGTVVGSTFRGKDVMRSRPRKSSKPASATQLAQRVKFATAIQFLTPVKVIIDLYYGSPAGIKSRFNLAVSHLMKMAISVTDLVATIDYSQVMYAKGTLLSAQNLECTLKPQAKIDFTWIDNSTQAAAKATDQLLVVVVEENTVDYQIFFNAGVRSAATATVTLPTYLVGLKVNVYGFMVSQDGKINSTSQFLGLHNVE